MQGYFVVYSTEENERFDIKCELHPDFAKEEVPNDQQELYLEVEDANNVLKSLHNTKDEIKVKYFNKLLSLAQAGLVGETAQPQLALKALNKLKAEVMLIEGKRIKNEYMKKLGINALILSIIIFVVYNIILQYDGRMLQGRVYCSAFVGALIGTWISFGARKFRINFSELSLLEEDMMSPCIRLIYIGLCAIIFMLFLNTQIVTFEIGNISTDSLQNSFEIQVAVGILCGLIESKIGINIYKKAISLFGEEEITK
ncbi:MAG: hypothetical protein KHY44_13695 [Clostridiales bacterium]|nr:hypothetical protein [Clostridiales bacterium]